MRKFLKETYPFIIGWVVAIALLYIGRSQGYERGYQPGFDKGLDTAAAIDDKSFDSLITVMKADHKEVQAILIDLGAMQTESFPNNSEIKP